MRRVLVIDDEESLGRNIKDYLEMKGYGVSVCLDGTSGMEMFKKENPCLLILDLHLKDGPTGIQFLQMAKKLNPDVKVIVFTGFGEQDDTKDKCVSLGADEFLSKPTSLKTLAEIVDRLVK